MFSRLYRRRSPAALTATALVTAAIALGSLALVTPLPTALAPLLVFWLAANIVVTTGITYRQTSTPDLLLARVNVVGRMIAWGGRPAGAAVIGILASGIGVRVTFAVTAVSLLLGGVTCAAFHQRAVGQLRPHDAILTLPGR